MGRRGALLILFFCFLAYLFASPNTSSKNSVLIAPFFLLHSINTKVTRDESKTDDMYRTLVRPVSDDIYRDTSLCFGTSLSVNIDIVYLSFKVAFPLQMQTTFLKFPSHLEKTQSFLADFEVGLCYRTFEKKPYNLLFALSLGFGAVYINMSGDIEENKKISYTKTDLMLGLGGNVIFTYSFHKVMGIYFGIGDMFYFMNIRTYRLLKSDKQELIFEEKLKSENFNAINTFANSLSIKAGLMFSF